jgi:hypothetical protein
VLTVTGRGSGNANSTPEVASLPLSVGNEDLAGVSVATSKGGSIRGTVVADNNGKVQTANIQVSVQPLRQTLGGFTPRGQVSAAGTFELTSLIGTHVLRVDRLPDGWNVKSIRANGKDITDAPIDFRGSEQVIVPGRADQPHQRAQWHRESERTDRDIRKRRPVSRRSGAVAVPGQAGADGPRRSERRLPDHVAAGRASATSRSPWTTSNRVSSRTRCSWSAEGPRGGVLAQRRREQESRSHAR